MFDPRFVWFVLTEVAIILSTIGMCLLIVGMWKLYEVKIEKEKVKEMAIQKFAPMVVPDGKMMGWKVARIIAFGEGLLTEALEVVTPGGEITTAKVLPGTKVKVQITEITDLRFLDVVNPRVGNFYMAWNGRFGQPLIKQNPGRMVIYATKHPELGWLLGGAEEPRDHCNGTMRTAAGGYDPAAGSELEAIKKMEEGAEKVAALEKYGKANAAREILQEMGLDVTDMDEVGKGLSNRSIYFADLTDMSTWNGETYYVVVVPFDMLTQMPGGGYAIQLPADKEGDVRPAPEWSSISKLEFLPALDNFASPDSVAVTGYAKAYAWLVKNLGA